MTPNKHLHAPSNPWVFFSAIVALAIAANQAKSEIAQSPAVAALEASMVAWRQKIDFKSTYKYRHGLAGSLADEV